MSGLAHVSEGALLWTPTAGFVEASTLTDYRHWLDRERGLVFGDYDALWRWSVDDLGAFWTSVVDYYDLPLRGRWEHPVAGAMPGARWFEGARINYAEAILRRVSPGAPALLFQSERQPLREIDGAELTA
ncbi:MAG: acetyl-coenzyme A synthetase N-terminal domain-containing protein, partial [Chloroflexota bacterium]